MTTTPTTAPPSPPGRRREASTAAPVTAAQVKRRRSPLLIALAVALVAVGGLVSLFLYTTVSETTSVVAARDTIERGSVIDADDLVNVQITTDPSLKPVKATDRDSLIGKRATVDIAGGSLLTSESVSDELTPGKGSSVVGLSLSAAQRPASELRNGDQVRIVQTPAEGFDAVTSGLPTIEASVVSVGEIGVDGNRVVDVSVDANQATDLAAQASTGRIALVLDSREN